MHAIHHSIHSVGARLGMAEKSRDREGLTRRQSQVLAELCEFVRRYNASPTLRQLGRLVGSKSSSSIAWICTELVRRGWADKEPGRQRSLTPRYYPDGKPFRDDPVWSVREVITAYDDGRAAAMMGKGLQTSERYHGKQREAFALGWNAVKEGRAGDEPVSIDANGVRTVRAGTNPPKSQPAKSLSGR